MIAHIRFVGDVLIIGNARLELEHEIFTAWRVDGRVLVLFDPDAVSDKVGQFANLVALDDAGQRLWVAEMPTTITGDRYYRVESMNPIIVCSVSSFDCTIDPETGLILDQEFTK